MPKNAAWPELMSTLRTRIVSVRRLHRSGPASLPRRSRFNRPSFAQFAASGRAETLGGLVGWGSA